MSCVPFILYSETVLFCLPAGMFMGALLCVCELEAHYVPGVLPEVVLVC